MFSKHPETISGFWYIDISELVNSPYFDGFYITIDEFNRIHSIQGNKKYPNKDRCLTFLKKRVTKIGIRKEINFTYEELDVGTILFKRYVSHRDNISEYIQCNESFEPRSYYMNHFVRSVDFSRAVLAYYEKD